MHSVNQLRLTSPLMALQDKLECWGLPQAQYMLGLFAACAKSMHAQQHSTTAAIRLAKISAPGTEAQAILSSSMT